MNANQLPKSILKPRKLSKTCDSIVYQQAIHEKRNARAGSSERSAEGWPINIERLNGKHEESDGYRLEISRNEAILKKMADNKEDKEIMKIRVENGNQKVGIPNSFNGHLGYKWFQSKETIPRPNQQDYITAIRILGKIKWKVAKVIFHNSSVCRGGTIRLMENGDMRMKDERRVMYNVRANTNEVREGDPKHSTVLVTNPTKQQQILKYRDLCKETEAMIERLGFSFPFVSSEITDGAPNQSLRHMAQRGESILMNRSAPCRLLAHSGHENKKRQFVVLKSKSGEVSFLRSSSRLSLIRILGVKDKSTGISLRVSSRNSSQYVYTKTNGVEERFSFYGHYQELPQHQANLMRKLNDLRR